MKKRISCLVTAMFLLSILAPLNVFAQAGTHVMTLGDGTKVFMTKDQLAALAQQPGVKVVSSLPTLASDQIAIPIPSELGGGFIVSEPHTLSVALNTLKITTAATTGSVAGATAAGAEGIKIGAYAAGLATKGGFAVGTTTMIIVGGAALVGGAIAIGSGGGGGGTTAHH